MKNDQLQTSVYKTQHIELKVEQHKPIQHRLHLFPNMMVEDYQSSC